MEHPVRGDQPQNPMNRSSHRQSSREGGGMNYSAAASPHYNRRSGGVSPAPRHSGGTSPNAETNSNSSTSIGPNPKQNVQKPTQSGAGPHLGLATAAGSGEKKEWSPQPATTACPPDGEDESDVCFPIGATAEIINYDGEKRVGEIMAFDAATKFVALKLPSNGVGAKKALHLHPSVTVLNLSSCKQAKILKEASPGFVPSQLASVDYIPKATQKLEKQLEKKRRSFTTVPVSVEGQRVFLAIQKTIGDISWNKDSIIVLKTTVMVKPPYTVHDVVQNVQAGSSKDKMPPKHIVESISHVKKIVAKHYRDYQQRKDGVDTEVKEDFPPLDHPSPTSFSPSPPSLQPPEGNFSYSDALKHN